MELDKIRAQTKWLNTVPTDTIVLWYLQLAALKYSPNWTYHFVIIEMFAVIKLCYAELDVIKTPLRWWLLKILRWLIRLMRLHMRNLKKPRKMFVLKKTWESSLPLFWHSFLLLECGPRLLRKQFSILHRTWHTRNDTSQQRRTNDAFNNYSVLISSGWSEMLEKRTWSKGRNVKIV